MTLDFSQNFIPPFRLSITLSVLGKHSISALCCIIQSFFLRHWPRQIIRLLGHSRKQSTLLLHSRSCRLPNLSTLFKHSYCLQHGLRPIHKAARFTTKRGCMWALQCTWLNVWAYIEVFSRPNTHRTKVKPTKTLVGNGYELGLVALSSANCIVF